MAKADKYADPDPPEPKADPKPSKGDSREENGKTIYSSGGVDLIAHKKGSEHYTALLSIPGQGMHKDHKYHLSPPNFEESLGLVLKNFAANIPPAPVSIEG